MGYNNGNCYEVQSYFGMELDELCRNLYGRLMIGTVNRGTRGRDGGRDAAIRSPDGAPVYIQCKSGKKSASISDMREFVTVCNLDGAEGMFISLSGFSPEAIKLAAQVGIALLDYGELCRDAAEAGMGFYYIRYDEWPNVDYPEENGVCNVSVRFAGLSGSAAATRISVDCSDFHKICSKHSLNISMKKGRHRIRIRNNVGYDDHFDLNIQGDIDIVLRMRNSDYVYDIVEWSVQNRGPNIFENPFLLLGFFSTGLGPLCSFPVMILGSYLIL